MILVITFLSPNGCHFDRFRQNYDHFEGKIEPDQIFRVPEARSANKCEFSALKALTF